MKNWVRLVGEGLVFRKLKVKDVERINSILATVWHVGGWNIKIMGKLCKFVYIDTYI